MHRPTALVGPLFAFAIVAAPPGHAADQPKSYVTYCKEDKACKPPGGALVAFGRANKFHYRQLSEAFVCDEATFGGRTPGGINECSVPKIVVATRPPPAASAPATSSATDDPEPRPQEGPTPPYDTGSKSTYLECALQGQRCSFIGTRTVVIGGCYRVGSITEWVRQCHTSAPMQFTNGVDCAMANFPNARDFGVTARTDRCYALPIPELGSAGHASLPLRA
ncbi:hypothetical protein [Uliginosibacterium sp. H1]|uniref:hypothetical protein n=1 Tax=Uliginosibacterium sp. H1 TaxID=3114757 RepID=UPI002E191C3D|nr:hypothetical protein [Uliginosibacterium sp. H1]